MRTLGTAADGGISDGRTIKKEGKKYDPNMIPGIFLGYKLHSGCRFRGEYYVAALDEFMGLNFQKA